MTRKRTRLWLVAAALLERIGEAQRFTAKVVAERAAAASPKPPRDAGT